MNLYPSILTDSLELAQQQINIVKKIEEIKTIQVDIVDGNFADNLTITPLDFIDLQLPENLNFDFHLMTDEPMDHFVEIDQIKDRVKVRSTIAQVEKMSYQKEFVEAVKNKGILAGLSLDLFTPIEAIEQDCWDMLDIVQVMAIEAGFQGHEFHPRVVKKIKALSAIIRTRKQNIELIADGGVKLNNFHDIVKAGANSVTVGSQIWESDDPPSVISKFLR